MEAYKKAKQGHRVILKMGDNIKKAIIESGTMRFCWVHNGISVSLNRNTLDGWEIVEEKKTLSDKLKGYHIEGSDARHYRHKDVKEALKDFIHYAVLIATPSSFCSCRDVKDKAIEIFGERLVE